MLLPLAVTLSYPWYFLVFCLLGGGLVAWLGYKRSALWKDAPRLWAHTAWALRFLYTAIIIFLLLIPIWQHQSTRLEKPLLPILMDNSASLTIGNDSTWLRQKWPSMLDKGMGRLQEKFDLLPYHFAGTLHDSLPYDYKGQSTNYSAALDKLYAQVYNRNLGGVLMITDGVYNDGIDPGFTIRRFNSPFYALALGDTTAKKDLILKNVRHNQYVYAGNSFVMQVQAQAQASMGSNTTLSVRNNGRVLFTKPLSISSNNYYTELPITLNAGSAGLQRYTISLSTIEGEVSTLNNSTDVFIDVLDGRKRILLVGAAPHPDMAALVRAVNRQSQYEILSITLDEYQKRVAKGDMNLDGYQLAILHHLPHQQHNADALLSALDKAKLPTLFIVGPRSPANMIDNLNAGVTINSGGLRGAEVSASANPDFNLFIISPECAEYVQTLPPLYALPSGIKSSSPTQVALWQRISKTTVTNPLLQFATVGGRKTAIFSGIDLYRWWLTTYEQKANFALADEIWFKTFQYLGAKTDNRLFRAKPTQFLYNEDEPVVFEAELYNPSFEPIPNAKISLRLQSEVAGSKPILREFEPRGTAYSAQLGFLPRGTYNYEAKTQANGTNYSLKGQLIVRQTALEFKETVANHGLLRSLAEQQGGMVALAPQWDAMIDSLLLSDTAKPIRFQESSFEELMHYKWWFFLILLLFSAEWIIRKYWGSAV